MFKLVRSYTVPLTRELALEFRDMKPSIVERKLDEKRVKHLREKFERGLLIPFHWAKLVYPGRPDERLNGQHSSYMLAGLEPFPQGLYVHIDEFSVESIKDVPLIFRQFDDRKSSRTPKDVSRSYQIITDDIREAPEIGAKRAAEGIAWHRNVVDGLPMLRGDDRYELLNDPGYAEFILWAGELLSRYANIRRDPVVAAMYSTWLVSPQHCRAFWQDVLKGGEDSSVAADLLATFLGELRDRSKRSVPTGGVYQACVSAWNHHVRGSVPPKKRLQTSAKDGFETLEGPASE